MSAPIGSEPVRASHENEKIAQRTLKPRPRSALVVQAWVIIAFQTGLYIYANLATSHGDVVMIVAGIAAPIMFCLTVHLAAEQRGRHVPKAVRRCSAALTVVVLLCTGAWSWVHLTSLVHDQAHMPILQAVLMPVLVDCVLLIALLSLELQRIAIREEAEAVEEGKRLALPPDTAKSVTATYGIAVEQESELTTLYQLLSADDEIIYVGVTSDLDQRLKTHRARKVWFDEVATMVVRTYPTRGQALAVEEHVIAEKWPRYNANSGNLHDHHAHSVPSRPVTPPERRTINPAPRIRAHADELDTLSRDALREVARHEGVAVRGSRGEVAERIRAARDANFPAEISLHSGTAGGADAAAPAQLEAAPRTEPNEEAS